MAGRTGEPRGSGVVHHIIEIVPETGSTNADLLARLRAGEELDELHWLLAERQTAGRGRMGREWDGPSGNLHASTIIQLKSGDPVASTLSFVAGLAAFDAIERSLLPNTAMLVKWPNDVMVNKAKIAGILLERHANQVVIGFGVNVCHAPEIAGRRTTNILYENGKHGGNPELVHSILHDCLKARLAQWRGAGLAVIMLDWSARSHRYNDPLKLTLPGEEQPVEGTYRGVTPDGALLYYAIGKGKQTLHAGDVMLV